MPFAKPLDYLPLWGLFLATVAVVMFALEAGYRLGRHRSRRTEQEKESPVGAVVAATLGLLGFMLAFTFGIAGSRYDARRQAVLDEANAIGTTFLRAGLLPEGRGESIRNLLRSYVDARLDAARTGDIESAVRRSSELHGQIWAKTEAIATKHPESILVGLFVQSLNETIDLHETRVVVGLYNRIPLILWGTLYFLAALTMIGVGYHAGLTSKVRSPAILVLVLTFSAVMVLVADLDRPLEGMLRVSQQALVDLRSTMGEPHPRETIGSGDRSDPAASSAGANMGNPRYPSRHQASTRVWLTELSQRLVRPATLDGIPQVDLDRLAEMGFDRVWFLSVWQTGLAGPQFSRGNPRWRLHDQMSSDVYDRDGGDLQSRGLFLDMSPWQTGVYSWEAKT